MLEWTTWLALPGYVLLLLMLVFPMVSQLLYIKALLFGCVLIIVAVNVLATGKLALHPSVALWTLFLVTISFFFVLRGFFVGTPGALKAAQLYVAWPVIYTIVIAGAARPRILTGLQWTLVVATLCIAAHGGIYLLNEADILPPNRYIDFLSFGWEDQAIGFHEGYIGMQFPGLNSLPFLIPFLMAAVVLRFPSETGKPVSRPLLLTTVFLGLGVVLGSGRRALILVTLIAPALIAVFLSLLPAEAKRLSRSSLVRLAVVVVLSVVVLLLGLNAIYEVSPSGILDRLSQGFDFGPTTFDEGANARREQYSALLLGWYESPLLGAGHGASAYGSVRSDAMPWAYELSYLALLYQTGLVGFLAYAGGIAWIYWMGARMIKEGGTLSHSVLPVLVGMSSYLMANATNPYLTRFDGIWAIFLPLAFINYWLLIRGADAKPAGRDAPRVLQQM